MTRKVWHLVVGTIFFCISIGVAKADKRVALVIGNGAYINVPSLPNPPNDAEDVAAAFKRLGFSVDNVSNAGFDEMRGALRRFGSEAQGADIAVVFFAGHGMEIRGENWLIPVDAELKSDTDAEGEAISLKNVSLQVEKAAHLGLVILDACRNNPFVKMQRSASYRAVDRGLVRVEPSTNVLVVYAARDGTTASDGDGRNSPFSSALLANVEKPGLEVSLLFRKVRDEVMTKTKREQQPFVYGSLSKELVYLKPPPSPADKPQQLTHAAPSEVAAPDIVTDCDRLAAHPKDIDRPGGIAGVYIAQIEAGPASAACNAAMLQYPKTARFVFQAGRIAYAQRNYKQAGEFYRRAAGDGHSQAAVNLGQLYQSGEGVAQDLAQTRSWYEKAAAAGNAAGLNALGTLYEKGQGVPKDFDQARKWYLAAAAAGDADAFKNVGYFYANGYGVARDFSEARGWYEKAAAANHPGGMNSLGVLYQLGNGVPQNYVTAREWFEKAAAAGDRDAMKNLGGLYFNGFGVDKDYAEARNWYEKAAANGSSDAMSDLGLLYANGLGVEKDIAASRRWYEKAAAAGNENAKSVLNSTAASQKDRR